MCFFRSPQYDQGSAELTQVKSLYAALQRRIQDMDRLMKNNTIEYQERIKVISHEKEVIIRNFYRKQSFPK